MTRLTPSEFDAAFDRAFQRSAFRLELLDRYASADEAGPLSQFLAGKSPDPAWCEPWARYVREAVHDGKQMGRVHVVDEPLSDYLRFELTCGYPATVAAGEDIRIMDLEDYPILTFPLRDFWLFDDATAAVMDYDDDGVFLGADLTTAPVRIARYRHVRDYLLEHSVPLADYPGERAEAS